MATTPLASQADLTPGPLYELVRDWSSAEVDKLMARASRAVESDCDRRLASFTSLVETSRADMLDDSSELGDGLPLDLQGAIGRDRLRTYTLSAADLVRHVWLRQAPPCYPDLWSGAIQSITVARDYTGTQTLAVSGLQYEPDTGHVRFQLGSFIPVGSTIVVTYSGGYAPVVPDDLILATIFKAAILAIVEIEPDQRPAALADMREECASLLVPYVR